jgi:SAM-dependent methyltransferase
LYRGQTWRIRRAGRRYPSFIMSVSALALAGVSSCPACGSDRARALGAVRDTLVEELNRALPLTEARLPPLENGLEQCRACSLAYLSPRLATGSLERLYELWYRFGYGETPSAQDGDAKRASEFKTHHLAFLERTVGRPGRLLDVGAGTGLFVQVAREHGWDAHGIDWTEAAVQGATAAGREGVTRGTLRAGAFAQGAFETITMFDYLEHTQTPREDIRAAAAILPSGGHLAVRVPNFGSFQRRVAGLAWPGIFCLHLSYFNRRSLRRLLDESGFEIEFVHSGNHQSLGDLVGGKLRWIAARLRRRPPASSGQFPETGQLAAARPRVFAYLWGSVLEALDHAAGWFGKGQILFMIGRKR